jgi:hypothetical protein
MQMGDKKFIPLCLELIPDILHNADLAQGPKIMSTLGASTILRATQSDFHTFTGEKGHFETQLECRKSPVFAFLKGVL